MSRSCRPGRSAWSTQCYRRASSGESGARDPSNDDFLLKSPLRLGAQWPILGGTATVAAVAKTVTVPAGDFSNCVVVEENRSTPARLVRTTYAPGTGPIAVDLLVHDEVTGAFQPALRARLRGVTAPGPTRRACPPETRRHRGRRRAYPWRADGIDAYFS